MPIWVNENKDGLEFVCVCDQCGVEGPPSLSDDEAVEGFYPIHEEGRDAIYRCSFCHVLLEEEPVSEDVAVNRIIAVLQQQGAGPSFVSDARARELVGGLVQDLARDQAFAAVPPTTPDFIDFSFTRYPIDGFTRIKPPPKLGPFVDLPSWVATGMLVRRANTVLRIKAVTVSEVVLNNGSQLVVWSRSQRPFEEEFQPAAPERTRADFILEEE